MGEDNYRCGKCGGAHGPDDPCDEVEDDAEG